MRKGTDLMSIKIIKAGRNDLQEILNLQYLAYQSEAALFRSKDIPPLKQTLDDLMDEYEKGIVLKAVTEEEIIIGSVRAYENEGTVYIGKLMVYPDYRRQGYGSKLLTEIEKCYTGKRYELFTLQEGVFERGVHNVVVSIIEGRQKKHSSRDSVAISTDVAALSFCSLHFVVLL